MDDFLHVFDTVLANLNLPFLFKILKIGIWFYNLAFVCFIAETSLWKTALFSKALVFATAK